MTRALDSEMPVKAHGTGTIGSAVGRNMAVQGSELIEAQDGPGGAIRPPDLKHMGGHDRGENTGCR